MTLAIVDSSSGAASAAAMNPATVSGVAGRMSIPPTIAGSSWSRYWKRVTTPKLPPPPRIAQNRSGSISASTRQTCAVGGDDLGGEQVVDRQAVLAHEVADAAAERDPADARPSRCRRSRCQAVLAGGGRVLAGGQAGLGPGGPAGDVDVEAVRSRRSRTMPPSVVLWPAPLWPPLRTASSRPVSRASATTRGDVGRVGDPDDRPPAGGRCPPSTTARASS